MKEPNTNNHPMELSDLDLEHVQGGLAKAAGGLVMASKTWFVVRAFQALRGG